MLRKSLAIALVAFAISGPAVASQCPKDMAAIDEALKTANLSDADKAKVMELRAKGEEQHKAKDHAGSVETLGQAKKMLGL